MDNDIRALGILFRVMRGEEFSLRKLADEYGVSTKSISRDISKINVSLAENRDRTGGAQIEYHHERRKYYLTYDEFMSGREVFAIIKALLGTRAFSKADADALICKFKRNTSADDQKMLDEIVRKEMLHYSEIKHDCDNVMDNLWRLINVLHSKKEITIRYNKIDRTVSEKRIQPASLIFMDFYFYLIAYYPEKYDEPRYFRVDRITQIIEHRKSRVTKQMPGFDEGLLRKRCQFMFFGKLRTIRFLYTGPSVQAVLDKLPTARIIESGRGSCLIEVETHGDGIKLFLLSQGAWVKVLEPREFVDEMVSEIDKMRKLYNNDEKK